jgi:hypothetical protein
MMNPVIKFRFIIFGNTSQQTKNELVGVIGACHILSSPPLSVSLWVGGWLAGSSPFTSKTFDSVKKRNRKQSAAIHHFLSFHLPPCIQHHHDEWNTKNHIIVRSKSKFKVSITRVVVVRCVGVAATIHVGPVRLCLPPRCGNSYNSVRQSQIINAIVIFVVIVVIVVIVTMAAVETIARTMKTAFITR